MIYWPMQQHVRSKTLLLFHYSSDSIPDGDWRGNEAMRVITQSQLPSTGILTYSGEEAQYKLCQILYHDELVHRPSIYKFIFIDCDFKVIHFLGLLLIQDSIFILLKK